MKSVSNKMKLTRFLKASLAGMCLLAFGDVSARALIGLDYSVMTGNTVQVVFTFDQAAIAPRKADIDFVTLRVGSGVDHRQFDCDVFAGGQRAGRRCVAAKVLVRAKYFAGNRIGPPVA